MKTINMHEAKTHLSKIVAQVAKGESVIIGNSGRPMALLSPYVSEAKSRKPGSMKGRIWIADDFDADSDLIADMFHGRPEES